MMSLEQEIAKHSATVSTESYSMSVGEMVSMYKDGELDLHPEYQRFFRWTDEQKSRLIESLLLGIPIPPIFVSERPDSKWDVIDGLQRLSTILEVMGELRDQNGNQRPPLILSRTIYLPSLEGKRWFSDNPEDELPESARIKIKRARLDVNIVRNISDEIAKYEIFQRLNSGGSLATDQEVRNCILVMVNPDYFGWIKVLAENDLFRSCIPLSDRALDEAFDLELVTRFVILSTSDYDKLRRIDEIGSFLTNESVLRAKDPNFSKQDVERAFTITFGFLEKYLAQDSFRRFDKSKNRYIGPMLVSLFEVVAIGMGMWLMNGYDLPDPEVFLAKHRSLWSQVSTFSGSGVRASTRIPQTVSYGREWLKECQSEARKN